MCSSGWSGVIAGRSGSPHVAHRCPVRDGSSPRIGQRIYEYAKNVFDKPALANDYTEEIEKVIAAEERANGQFIIRAHFFERSNEMQGFKSIYEKEPGAPAAPWGQQIDRGKFCAAIKKPEFANYGLVKERSSFFGRFSIAGHDKEHDKNMYYTLLHARWCCGQSVEWVAGAAAGEGKAE